MYKIKQSDWDKVESEHRDYCGRSIHDTNIRVIFEGIIPGNRGKGGTALLFEHKHFEIILDSQYKEETK